MRPKLNGEAVQLGSLLCKLLKQPLVARVGDDQVKAQCPVMVGVMDTSISRVLDRISSLEGLPIDGVVTTVSVYNTLTQTEVYDFYKALADNSPFPIYMYDLAGVEKVRQTLSQEGLL